MDGSSMTAKCTMRFCGKVCVKNVFMAQFLTKEILLPQISEDKLAS